MSFFQNLIRNMSSRGEIKAEIDRLRPWYQPIDFGHGLRTPATDKTGARFSKKSLDRGIAKWKTFIEPNLPFSLGGKRVLEIGCNAGLFVNEMAQQGVREAVGLEKDDHYYEQALFTAKTFSHLNDRRYPVRIYQSSMEDFDYEGLGYFDLTLMLLVIYHIGKTEEYNHLSQEEIVDLQVNTLVRVSTISRYILFQGNPLADGGRGKGIASLNSLVEKAGLKVVKETKYDHDRGYVLLTESPRCNPEKTYPVSRMVNKYFKRADESAERDLADRYYQNGSDCGVTDTLYYRLRTAQTDWNNPVAARLPQNLDNKPVYWVMPWSVKRRTLAPDETAKRISGFDILWKKYQGLLDSVAQKGFDVKREPILGFELVHPERGSLFLYTDGNQRMGALSAYAAKNDATMEVPVFVRQSLHREKLTSYPLTKQLMAEGLFTEKDVYAWFDNAFDALGA